MPKVVNRVGETNIANNGLKMTIIAYHSACDIDVQFEDDVVVTHKKYSEFKRGLIGHPNINLRNRRESEKHIGESIKATNGMQMTIIAYRKYQDIDVKFEDGTIVKHRGYQGFKRGKIQHPTIRSLRKTGRIGETNIANNGKQMTITAYRGVDDIDVQFEDGSIVEHRSYGSFLRGKITYKGLHIGETNIASNGMRMTIIGYRVNRDIDIQFEDGVIVEHKDYDNFRKGAILHPYLKVYNGNLCRNHLNEHSIARNSCMWMTIIGYRSTRDFDVQFESGYTISHTDYSSFKRGNIKHPFPYNIGTITMKKPAYIFGTVGNFYCQCNSCGHEDIMTIEEMKSHKCNI